MAQPTPIAQAAPAPAQVAVQAAPAPATVIVKQQPQQPVQPPTVLTNSNQVDTIYKCCGCMDPVRLDSGMWRTEDFRLCESSTFTAPIAAGGITINRGPCCNSGFIEGAGPVCCISDDEWFHVERAVFMSQPQFNHQTLTVFSSGACCNSVSARAENGLFIAEQNTLCGESRTVIPLTALRTGQSTECFVYQKMMFSGDTINTRVVAPPEFTDMNQVDVVLSLLRNTYQRPHRPAMVKPY